MNWTVKTRKWRLLGHAGLLATAGVFLNCKCVDHPLYGAKVNRWDGYYMGGGNSQTRPFPAGFRSAALAEPAILQPTCTARGITLDVWAHDDVAATSIAVVYPTHARGLQRQRTAIVAGHGASQLVALDDAMAAVDLDQHVVVELEDGEGLLTSITMTGEQMAAALADCDAEHEPSTLEGKGE